MKTITDYTEKEIYAFSNKERNSIKQRAIMEVGIPIVREPEIPSYETLDAPEIQVNTIEGTAFYFTDENEAEKALLLLQSCKSLVKCEYDSIVGYDNRCIYSKYIISTKLGNTKVHAPEVYETVKGKAKRNKELKEEYDTAMKSFCQYKDSVVDIITPLNERFRSIDAKYDRLYSIQRAFRQEYLPTADGDKEMAIKFIKKAYTLNEEELSLVIEEEVAVPECFCE